MLQPVKGRGRGRDRLRNNPLTPNIFSQQLTPVIPSFTPLSENSETTKDNQSDSGISSTSPSIRYPSPPQSEGDGLVSPEHLPETAVHEDSHWMVTKLTDIEFDSNKRPKKPDELGTLGEQIKVIANYFPILQFPHRGLVYKYQIQIRNLKNLEIHRERRR